MSVLIRDVHTHQLPSEVGTAIVSVDAADWQPVDGQLYAVGLHPWTLSEEWGQQMEQWQSVLRSDFAGQIVMAGETGLDRLRGASLLVQRKVFEEVVRTAEERALPSVIHDVHAMAEVLAVRKALSASMPWLIHGFRGGPEQAAQYLRAGCHISLGRHYNPTTLLALPSDELFLESDAHPEDLDALYAEVAERLGRPVDVLRGQVNDNITKVLGR